MSKRRKLTTEFVNNAIPPNAGEEWIPDTKIKGFGLRSWATNSGTGKAFCIRSKDLNGNKVRLTYKPKYSNVRWELGMKKNDFSNSLGFYLNDARKWAKDEIDKLNGRLTLNEEKWVNYHWYDHKVDKLTFLNAAVAVQKGLLAQGKSNHYLDQVDFLFHKYIPDSTKHALILTIKADDIADILLAHSEHRGNLIVLRGFIVKVFKETSYFNNTLSRFPDDLYKAIRAKWSEKAKVLYPQILDYEKPVLEAVTNYLLGQKSNWQQAFCILAFLSFNAPLSRVMSARWDQIIEKTWYPYLPHEKIYWFECRQQISEEQAILIEKIKSLNSYSTLSSEYWFPSKFSRSKLHITTVDTIWRYCLHDLGLPYTSLIDFSLR